MMPHAASRRRRPLALPPAVLSLAGWTLLSSRTLVAGWAFLASLALLGLVPTARADEPKPAQDRQAQFDEPSLEFFEKQVRPVLVQRCYECHSGKTDEPKGGLRVDSRAALLAGGDTGPAIEPGKPEASLLIDAVNYGDIYQMPPKSKLPAAEIEILNRWVKLGAPWPVGDPAAVPMASGGEFDLDARKAAHWAWRPVQHRDPPPVGNQAWPRHGLDHFILARLEQSGLAPAADADRATLLRRVWFDLVGLPPTEQDLQAFLADPTPQALEQVVDQLLKSPRFGQRWARHWLDLVRYAETYGHEFDYAIPHATQYRDYVVRALNADVPYDQFVVEHLAGDLLAEPRRHPTDGYNESVIGTGFWFLGEATHAPVDVRGDEAGRIDNQLDVFSKTFLGLTVACARCHDHKFDAISTRDYYALCGYLQSSRRQEALLDPHDRIRQGAERIRAARQAGTELLRAALPEADDAAQQELALSLLAVRELRQDGVESAERTAEIAGTYGVPAERLRAWDAALRQPAVGEAEHPLRPWSVLGLAGDWDSEALDRLRRELREDLARAEQAVEQSPVLADFAQSTFDGWFTTGEAFSGAPTTGVQWDASQPRLAALEPGWAHGGADSPRLQGVLRSPTFTITHPRIWYRLRGQGVQLRVILDGYFMDVYNGLLFRGLAENFDTQGQVAWQAHAGDLGRYLGHKAYLEIIDHGDGFAAIDQIRFSAGGPPHLERNPLARQVLAGDGELDSSEALARAYARLWRQTLEHWHAGNASAAEIGWINWMLDQGLVGPTGEQLAAANQRLAERHQQMQNESRELPAPLRVLAMTDGTPEDELVHIRGNHRTLGEPVPRRSLTALGGDGQPAPADRSGRLQLARQLTSPDNPLTARVLVNRVWHHLLGRGIVPSVDNFGVLGQPPSHPELLDYLAGQFVQEGWSLKRLIRSIVLSRTYQMSSTPVPAAEQHDPENILLHRAPIRRLEGEAIRDAILQVSGRLDDSLEGGSVQVHITPFMQGRGRPGGNGPLDGNGRRSLYTEVRRNFLPPMMLAFDTPIPFSTMGRRNVSNVPAQALILMNDPFVVQQAEMWARRLLAPADLEPAARIQQMYRQALTRDATDDELAAALAFLAQQGQAHGLTEPQAMADPRVWTDLCHVVFNVKEFIYLR
ncbi:MAG: PSD1 domain-containing protein [Pirellulaceae bacterium]|nr:PSD1 domain-containing protein [Pirellulaceae bacterium]